MRRVLFVTYYFPPSGGPGVQRSLKFVKYLPDFGWMPTVLTVRPDRAAYPDLDPDLAADVPPSVVVERTSSWDPYALYARMLGREKSEVVSVGFLGEARTNVRQRFARWLRANVFLPDARVGWLPFAVSRARRLLRDHDVVLTTGPPHSTHLIGMLLSTIHRKPWLVDFRDPWSGIDYAAELPTSTLARRVDARLERLVLGRASAGTVVSEDMRRRLAGEVAFSVIENGFDPDDFRNARGVHPARDRFVLAHVGNLNAARNPTALWRALGTMDHRRELPLLKILLIGNVDPAVPAAAAEYGVSDLIEREPYLPHQEAVRRMCASAMLLLCINRVEGAGGIVTGKVYEYVASGRPVLGIGPVRGDAARVLHDSGAGRLFDFDDAPAVAAYLREGYRLWESGMPVTGAPSERAARYSRREQAGALAGVLERLLKGPPA